MITERLLALRERRAQFVAHAEIERESAARLVARAETATRWFERGRALLHTVRGHPEWIAAAVALLVIVRPRKSLRLLATGLSLWRGWRSLRASLARLMPDPAIPRGKY